MYCLKVEKYRTESKCKDFAIREVVDTQFLSFENFRDLYEMKQSFDRKGNRWYKYSTNVYKVSNNGVRIEELTDKNLYKEIQNLDRELHDSITSYSYLRSILEKGKLTFFVKQSKDTGRDILYVKLKDKKVLEIEKTRKTPKYEVRFGKDLLFEETAQNDIVRILKNEYNIELDK